MSSPEQSSTRSCRPSCTQTLSPWEQLLIPVGTTQSRRQVLYQAAENMQLVYTIEVTGTLTLTQPDGGKCTGCSQMHSMLCGSMCVKNWTVNTKHVLPLLFP